MYKYIFILSISIILFFNSCGEQASQASVASPSAAVKSQPQQKVNPIKANQTSLKLNISSVDAKKGEEACVSFLIGDFDNIMAYQHSINFNPKELEYVRTKNYGLPHLTEANFGATKASSGYINFLWYDMNVKGISLVDKTKVFDLCFKTLASKGAACKVKISDKPIEMEVIGSQKQKLELSSSEGVIHIK